MTIPTAGEYADCCDTPSYCSSVHRCTAKDAKPLDHIADLVHRGPRGTALHITTAGLNLPAGRYKLVVATTTQSPHCAGFARPLSSGGNECDARDAALWRKWLPWLSRLNRKPFNLAKDVDNALGANKEG